MRRPEAALQRTVVAWLRLLENQRLLWFTHVGHGGGGRVRGAILKGLGLKTGVADLLLLFPGGRYGFLELKARGGRQSPEQREFQAIVERMGGLYAMARSFEVADRIVEEWLAPALAERAARRVA